jgi:hypothetical protein
MSEFRRDNVVLKGILNRHSRVTSIYFSRRIQQSFANRRGYIPENTAVGKTMSLYGNMGVKGTAE